MYNKLFTKILDSSIWLEDLPTRIVWVTFLAMMDQDGTVALSGIGNVAGRARVSEKEATHAIKVLESPDTRNPGQDRDGRRIERIPGVGWVVLNASKYRDLIKAETIRAQTRERVRRHRGNAPVTQANEKVTPSGAGAETKAGAKAEGEKKGPAHTLLKSFLVRTNPESLEEWKSLAKFEAKCKDMDETVSFLEWAIPEARKRLPEVQYARHCLPEAAAWKAKRRTA